MRQYFLWKTIPQQDGTKKFITGDISSILNKYSNIKVVPMVSDHINRTRLGYIEYTTNTAKEIKTDIAKVDLQYDIIPLTGAEAEARLSSNFTRNADGSYQTYPIIPEMHLMGEKHKVI